MSVTELERIKRRFSTLPHVSPRTLDALAEQSRLLFARLAEDMRIEGEQHHVCHYVPFVEITVYR